MKLVWTGTDSLLLKKFPKQMKWWEYWYVIKIRLFARWADKKVQSHYYRGELVKRNLQDFGMEKPIEEFVSPVKYTIKLDKIVHNGFNILYYRSPFNNKFNEWIYGYDIFLEIKKYFESAKVEYPDVEFIEIRGGKDMTKIFPIVDLYIRPNRHDGHPRLVDECIIQEIPYLYTLENPNISIFLTNIKIIYETKYKIHLNQ